MRLVRLLISALILLAASAFGAAAAVTTGTLPSNVRYYLAPGTTSKGYANFVLVQKGTASADAARGNLLKLEHFTKKAPYEFLASKGIGYGPEGYVSYPDGNTVYNFREVPTYDKAVTDSTILLIFDLVRSFRGEQAIVIAGDFDQSLIESKLNLFSLTITPRRPSASKKGYRWNPTDGPVFIHTENNSSRTAGISLSWTSPRTPDDRLQSAQPLVSYMYAAQLGKVVEKRIRHSFAAKGIPLADFAFRYLDSAASSGDERYEFTVNFGVERLPEATAAIAEAFASLDAAGATLPELTDARMEMLTAASREFSLPQDNSSIADQCVSAFLYGTRIVSPETVRNFFSRRQMSAERDLKLFNGFSSALLDPRRALELRCDTPQGELDGAAFVQSFLDAWAAAVLEPAQAGIYRSSYADTLSLLRPGKSKVKLSSTTADPVTGGSIWTFSNGTRVVYKKTARKGVIDYGLLLKGGYTYVPSLGPGESAFVGDVAGLCRISGMSAADFADMLAANGIDMACTASMTDLRITGQAPTEKVELLLRALLSYSRDRRPDTTAFQYYKQCERLRQERFRMSRRGIIAAIDSTMSPGYYYPSTKNVELLGDDLPLRVDAYLNEQFGKFNDGMLVILGDIPEARLQKLLCDYLGAVTVSPSFSIRPKVEYELRPGWSTYTVEASHSSVGSGEVCVNVGMATRQSFTIRSYCAFLIATLAIQNAVTEALAPVGMYAETTIDAQVFPSERLALYITCKPCTEDGLPAGVLPAENFEVLRALRMGISKASRGSVTPSRLAVLKVALTNEMETWIARPDYLIRAVMMRGSECKDIVSDYKQAIAAVTLSDVNSIIHDLDFGSKMEYIVR